MMRTLIFLILITITSCNFLDRKNFMGDDCNNTKPIEGVYENFYDKNAENILVILPDGTFEQTFKKGSLIKKHKGTWKFFQKSCNIRFSELVFLHDLPKQYEEMDIYSSPGIHRKDNIMFIDHYNLSFYRKDN